MNLTEFLLARIADEERFARGIADSYDGLVAQLSSPPLTRELLGPHLARWDPARVLAECEAKRRIVEMARRFHAMPDDSGTDLVLDDVLRLLTLPYVDHPDYDPSWRP